MTRRLAVRAAALGALTTSLIGLAAQSASAASHPAAPAPPPRASVAAAHRAAAAPGTLATLARFFAHDGTLTPAQAAPRVDGATVPVYGLSPDFVRKVPGAPVARLETLATRAVASDGRTASVWTVRQGDSWKVVNIATGDDETRAAAAGSRLAAGGTVFHEPQINAWYVQQGDRIRPLDAEARKAVGPTGTTVAAYQERVAQAYGDKLPGSAYDRRGEAGGYGGPAAERSAVPGARPVATADGGIPVAAASAVAGAAALVALGLTGTTAVRRLRRR
ncbi:hypothetical protein [Streptomyces catenulae]|uniref:Uncharacterized protein n=1 Tax=Streptomyces catenulae TaxID=66875 RepID=A0ABV2Z783_9ACTN|nr:hypothetical protein [Streptomyces catenulae]